MPLALRPFARAFYMLVVRRAFLDGRAGLLYVGMLCVDEAMIALQVYDRSLYGANAATSPDGERPGLGSAR